MKIKLDKIETTGKINGLGLKKSVLIDHYDELYFDTDLDMYVCVRPADVSDAKYSGKVLLERNQVKCAQVSRESVPKHQPIGTPETHDTPKGTRKKRSVEGAKSAIAERIAAREAVEQSVD